MVGYPKQPGCIWTCSQVRELSCEIGESSIQGKFTCYIFQVCIRILLHFLLPAAYLQHKKHKGKGGFIAAFVESKPEPNE
ncbi:uncharacterized protein LOC18097008 isoform X5 [Populus trichocarpa]|uniref:uncharacterized protein LOC18097008 isoform X5 n=1 Tax=Populus trichocarpa TaxID=3694 RepID=UPI0022787786|nr:uncharacterized protein LOC18097008 isoform X5 [Populus trichocarpa]